MRYRAFGIEIRHVAVDVDAETYQDAAQKALEAFRNGEAENSHSDDPEYDEDIEIAPYIDGDWDINQMKLINGSRFKAREEKK